MAVLTTTYKGVQLSEENIKLQKTLQDIQSLAEESLTKRTKKVITENLAFFLDTARNIKDNIITQIDNDLQELDKLETMGTNPEIKSKKNKLSIQITYSMRQIYEFIERFREFITKEVIDYLVGVETKGGQNAEVKIGIFTLQELLDIGDNNNLFNFRLKDGEAILSLRNRGAALTEAVENKSKQANDTLKVLENRFKMIAAQRNQEMAERRKIAKSIKEENKKAGNAPYSREDMTKAINAKLAENKREREIDNIGYLFESAAMQLAELGATEQSQKLEDLLEYYKTVYKTNYKDNVAYYRGGDFDKEITKRLLDIRKNIKHELQAKFLAKGGSVQITSLKTLKDVIDTIIIIANAGGSTDNIVKLLNAAIFKAKRNLNDKSIEAIKIIIKEQKENIVEQITKALTKA